MLLGILFQFIVFILIFGVGISCWGSFSATVSISVALVSGVVFFCIGGGGIGTGGGISGGDDTLGGGGGGGGSTGPA